MLHFDELVSYLENSFYTPTVDLALQQMFRVRQLINGNMHLFVNKVINVSFADYPISDIDIERFLDRNISTLNRYFPDETLAFESNTMVTREGVGYDKRRLSYEILKGIIAVKNKSLRYYTEIISNTLKNDYNIKCKQTLFDVPKDQLSKVVKLELESFNKLVPEEITEENLSSFFIQGDEYESLCEKECRQEDLTPRERLCKHIYRMAVEVWGIDLYTVDMDFFEKYIGYYNDKKVIKKSYEKYYKGLRFIDFLEYSEEDNKIRMHGALTNLANDEDRKKDTNLELYRTRITSYYVKLVEGTALLKSILGSELLEMAKAAWKEDKSFSDTGDHLKKGMETYLEQLRNDRFITIQRELDLDKRYFETKESIKGKELAYAKAVVREVFGMDLKTENRGTQDKKRKSYGNDTKCFNMSWLSDIKEKYDPKHLKITSPNEYLFLDTDEDDELGI